MRFVFLIVTIFAPVLAGAQTTTARERAEPTIVGFNGYALTISYAVVRDAPVPDKVVQKASIVCRSVGKSPELQTIDNYSDFRANFFFVCL